MAYREINLRVGAKYKANRWFARTNTG